MSVQNLRNAPAPEQSHDREPHPASGCSRGDRGAGWRWLKRRHRDIFSTADTFASALSPSVAPENGCIGDHLSSLRGTPALHVEGLCLARDNDVVHAPTPD